MIKLHKLNIFLILWILLIFSSSTVFAQQKQHRHKNAQIFIDANGDGYNDNAPDHDGDGIPNGLDPDWTKGQNRNRNYIDGDGDGINDLQQNNDRTEFQNGNMLQDGSSESISNDQDKQKGHQWGKGNK